MGCAIAKCSASTAGDPRLDQASVDLHVSAVSSGFGRAPFQLRVLANGQLLDTPPGRAGRRRIADRSASSPSPPTR